MRHFLWLGELAVDITLHFAVGQKCSGSLGLISASSTTPVKATRVPQLRFPCFSTKGPGSATTVQPLPFRLYTRFGAQPRFRNYIRVRFRHQNLDMLDMFQQIYHVRCLLPYETIHEKYAESLSLTHVFTLRLTLSPYSTWRWKSATEDFPSTLASVKIEDFPRWHVS